MFRGSSTQLYVPAFTQKDFHYIVHTGLPTQGTSTEDLGKYNLGVHNSSLTKYKLSLEVGTKPTQDQPLTRGMPTNSITSTLRGMALSQTNINLTLEG